MTQIVFVWKLVWSVVAYNSLDRKSNTLGKAKNEATLVHTSDFERKNNMCYIHVSNFEAKTRCGMFTLAILMQKRDVGCSH